MAERMKKAADDQILKASLQHNYLTIMLNNSFILPLQHVLGHICGHTLNFYVDLTFNWHYGIHLLSPLLHLVVNIYT